MSTEAQHASIPPRPPQPPTVGPPPSESRPQDAATTSGGVWSPWRGSEPFEAFGRRTPSVGSNAEAGPDSSAEPEPTRDGVAGGEAWSSPLSLGTVTAGSTKTVRIRAVVLSSVAKNTIISNSATATSTTVDPTPDADHSSDVLFAWSL